MLPRMLPLIECCDEEGDLFSDSASSSAVAFLLLAKASFIDSLMFMEVLRKCCNCSASTTAVCSAAGGLWLLLVVGGLSRSNTCCIWDTSSASSDDHSGGPGIACFALLESLMIGFVWCGVKGIGLPNPTLELAGTERIEFMLCCLFWLIFKFVRVS